MVQSTRKLYFSGAVTVFIIFYSALLLNPDPYLLQDPDTFWHISTGQWILDNAQFPTVDYFSYTAVGKPYISTEWLSQVFFAAAFKCGGWHAVVILTAISCSAIVGILYFYLVRHLRFSVAVGWAALTAVAISMHFLARPHIFSYVILVIWTINLLDIYDDDSFNISSLISLAPLMVLWANLHGSFTFGLALLYVFAGYRLYQNIVRQNYTKCRRILIIMLVVTLSALITPYGIAPAFETKELLDLKFTISKIIELRSIDFQTHQFHLIIFVALFSVMASLGIRLRGARLIVFGIITLLGLRYTRGLAMFFLLTPIILARPASACAWWLMPQHSQTSDGDDASDPVLQFLQRQSIAILISNIAIAALITVSAWWRGGFAPPENIAPKAAIDFVKRTNITGNVFNNYGFGGFLIFSGIPTFVDGRALPFGDEFLKKYFDASSLIDIKSSFELLDEYNVAWIILQPNEPLTKAIALSKSWNKVYFDKYSVVFTRVR